MSKVWDDYDRMAKELSLLPEDRRDEARLSHDAECIVGISNQRAGDIISTSVEDTARKEADALQLQRVHLGNAPTMLAASMIVNGYGPYGDVR